MLIFYDFETSSRDLLGQILTYSFIITDQNYKIIEECNGKIKIKRFELPQLEALLTNKIKISSHQKESDTEPIAAKKIFDFLSKIISTYPNCTLIGFNSNQFDLNFLRNCLIRNGLNPYFKNLKNKDILHFVQKIAFENPDSFQWQLQKSNIHQYYSFKLEDICKAHHILGSKQTHDAREDVILCIKLCEYIKKKFNQSLSEFSPIQFPIQSNCIEKIKTRHFAKKNESPAYFQEQFIYILSTNPKARLIINLTQLEAILTKTETPSTNELLPCIHYININKSTLVFSKISHEEQEKSQKIINKIKNHSLIKSLSQTPTEYFKYIEKNWDIEYQIHQLGFSEPINQLKKTLQSTNSPQNASSKINTLWSRYIINHSTAPPKQEIINYIKKRYITGELLKDWNSFESLEMIQEKCKETLNNKNLSVNDQEITKEYQLYFNNFIHTLKRYSLET